MTAAGFGLTALTASVAAPVSAVPVTVPVAFPASAPAALAGQPPTQEEVEAARQAAERSTAEAQAVQAQVQQAQAALDALALQANSALQAYQQALEAKQAAEQEEKKQLEALAVAERQLAEGQKQLGQWAAEAYKDGASLQQYSGLVTVLESRTTNDVSSLLASVNRLGQGRSSAVDSYRVAKIAAVDASARAEAAAATAREQSLKAEEAKVAADALVLQQRDRLAELERLRLAAEGDATSAADRAQNLAAARALADAALKAARGSVSVSGGLVGAVGECVGGDVSGYANGTIPRSALCPLWGAPTHVLRADAAHAFNQLSQAYAQQFGHPMCVTDSYRPLAEQISVAARKPHLAARPGTSRHGLGIAVDLCDGVNRYGSPTFTWLKQNAALYGWLHPDWAGPGGSGPFEPWHWEFTG